MVENFYNLVISEKNKIKRDIYCIAGFWAMNLFLFTMEIFFFQGKMDNYI